MIIYSGEYSEKLTHSRLYSNKKHCDMAISCGHVSIPVHHIILCSASPYFELALPGMLRVYPFPPQIGL